MSNKVPEYDHELQYHDILVHNIEIGCMDEGMYHT